ncbi:pentapeptide repeat-containing protein [Calothrix sp. NIES-4071]|nr:pentapeptide repeat-containing protein [Calothrix sp. NIES-4071]BAZ58228.1 pentapeptide repeat-containing protein [Calothrix sp. NIES-4105]
MKALEFLEKYAMGIRDFIGVDLGEANLSGAKLNGVNLANANLSVVNLSGANLNSANLRYAKLNVARLSGAHLMGADLKDASLNVANLIRADLSHAILRKASLIRTELIRANLSHADLMQANLKNADLREATLRQANLSGANLSDVNFRGGFLTGANLEQANLTNSDLCRTDFSGANLRDAEMKQANLSRANMSGANLSGANLRWVDLTDTDLRWADLSGAKLSGANLSGANLSNANLTGASLVHANLTQAKLIKAEWVGADLTGATLTGAKLYATPRFGLKTDGIICEWIDLSPTGDSSIIQYFTPEAARDFFNATSPTIRIIVDKPLDHEANFAISGAYFQIAQQYLKLKQPPCVEISRRRTVFTFSLSYDEALLPTACIVILPFQDARSTQRNLVRVVEMMKSDDTSNNASIPFHRIQSFNQQLEEAKAQADTIKQLKNILALTQRLAFFQAPTQVILTNSSSQNLIVHEHPNFGKRLINRSDVSDAVYEDKYDEAVKFIPFSVGTVIDFMKGFHYISQ